MASALKGSGSTSQWRKIRKRILERDSYCCQRCGDEGNSVDHIIPRNHGGSDEDWNLQTLCVSCNSAKGGGFFSSTVTPLTLPVSFYTKNDSKSHEND
jgi:hypothetical protein